MATPTLIRAYRFHGYSQENGPGNDVVFTVSGNYTTPTSGTAMTMQTVSVVPGALFSTAWFGWSGETIIKNANPYWLTINVTMNAVVVPGLTTTTTTANITIPPYGFWPVASNITAINTIVTGNIYDGTQPVAPSTQTLYLDVMKTGFGA